mmetsp:Transcript_20655/g.57911  ORF Transcript_20655/g.57911 Transcript_20655/m.57911 type:complete len:223 (-) Transcript_20655:135-803(-)
MPCCCFCLRIAKRSSASCVCRSRAAFASSTSSCLICSRSCHILGSCSAASVIASGGAALASPGLPCAPRDTPARVLQAASFFFALRSLSLSTAASQVEAASSPARTTKGLPSQSVLTQPLRGPSPLIRVYRRRLSQSCSCRIRARLPRRAASSGDDRDLPVRTTTPLWHTTSQTGFRARSTSRAARAHASVHPSSLLCSSSASCSSSLLLHASASPGLPSPS